MQPTLSVNPTSLSFAAKDQAKTIACTVANADGYTVGTSSSDAATSPPSPAGHDRHGHPDREHRQRTQRHGHGLSDQRRRRDQSRSEDRRRHAGCRRRFGTSRRYLRQDHESGRARQRHDGFHRLPSRAELTVFNWLLDSPITVKDSPAAITRMTKPKRTLSLTSGNYISYRIHVRSRSRRIQHQAGRQIPDRYGHYRQRKAQTGTRFGRCSGTAQDIHGGCQWRNRHDERIGNGRRTGIQLPRHLYDVRKQRIEPVPAPLCTSILRQRILLLQEKLS